ncbi:reverse transcriptase/maturase family protein [Enterocloster aldenensis]|jgi:retron-type reverse transcriptase|uniref:reverse transcriptase domain-containing protein n=2 Tax=Lachnospirales TaxID=3085636 RepID=UPI0025A3620E|nr:reverse transcriptase/maturase family protein [Enterocloster aldenensis]
MKTLKNVFEQVVDYDNLYRAYLNARLCKRYRYEVLNFSAHLEDNLVKLQKELIDRTYTLGKYREFYIYEPKKRLIMAQPFKDRVVQWAIYQVLNPVFAQGYITDSYACIKERGTHKAVKRLHYWLRQVGKKPEKYYFLKLDISKYFYRIDHDVLMGILKRKIRDDDMIFLLDKIVNSSETNFGLPPGKSPGEVKRSDRVSEKGMPVGNLSSQMFANLYLNELDQYCKRTLGIHFYVRYMDDVIILHQDKDQLHEWKRIIDTFLKEKLQLDLNEKTCIRPITLGVEFCGYKIWNTHIKLRKSTALKMKRNLKKLQKEYAAGEVTVEEAKQTISSYLGILKHCDSYSLKRTIFGEYGSSEEYEGWFFLQRATTETQ